MEILTNILRVNNYSSRTINRALQNKQAIRKPEPKRRAFLPYIKGTTDKISHVLRKHEIDTTFNTQRKIAEILPTPKETIPLENQGVYKIKCETCQLSYIGQTNRRITTRKEEHRNAVKQRTTSSLAKHVIDTGHKIDFEDVRMLARSENLTDRITREAIEIENPRLI
ncbi:hypothetical protein Trydic_g7731 [Trypoxylus dichotomus]